MRDVPPNTVWYGNPARFVKYISNEEEIYNNEEDMENMLVAGGELLIFNYLYGYYVGR